MKSCRARIRVSVRSSHVAASIRAALEPEIKRLPKTEGRAEISLRKMDIIFTIETSDIAALRASINSYLRLVDASYKCITL